MSDADRRGAGRALLDRRASDLRRPDAVGASRGHHRDHGSEWDRKDHAAAADHGPVERAAAAGCGCSAPRCGSLRRERLYELRLRAGMLFQNGALLTDLSVFENVAFPVREHAQSSRGGAARSWC